MPDASENARAMLKEYADTLIANAQATNDEEQGEIGDDLIDIEGRMEAHAMEIAELIHELLERSAEAAAHKPG